MKIKIHKSFYVKSTLLLSSENADKGKRYILKIIA